MKEIKEWLESDVGSVVSIVLYVVIVAAVTWLVAAIAKKLFRKWVRLHENRGSREMMITFLNVLRRIVVCLIYFGGVMAIVGQVPGLNKIATSLLAGSGIAAVALSVAAQSSVGNLVSGMLIALFKPFRVGDMVRYLDQDITGRVEEITLRHTIIRTLENKRLIIPNSTMNTEVIENDSYGSTVICMFLELEVSYDSDLDLAMDIVRGQVGGHPDFVDVRTEEEKERGAPRVVVRVQNFNSSGILLRALVWSPDSVKVFQMKGDILYGIKKEFDEKGVKIPYPHQTVILENPPAKRKELSEIVEKKEKSVEIQQK